MKSSPNKSVESSQFIFISFFPHKLILIYVLFAIAGDAADTAGTPLGTRVSRKIRKPNDLESDGHSDPTIEIVRVLDGNQKDLSNGHGIFMQQ